MSSVSRILLEAEISLVCLFISAIEQIKQPVVCFDIQMQGVIFNLEGIIV